MQIRKAAISAVTLAYVLNVSMLVLSGATECPTIWRVCKIDQEVACNGEIAYENLIKLAVGVEKESEDLLLLLSEMDGKVTSNITAHGELKALVIDLPMKNLARFETEAKCRYIERAKRFSVDSVPNDPLLKFQWGLEVIQASDAWSTTKGDASVLIAIIDTGVDYNHPDLAGNYVPLGYDWVNNDEDPMDDNGHGTHCAGIAVAVTNNDQGIAGTAQVQFLAEKGLDRYGSGWSFDLAQAIIHAVDAGANIISLSWGLNEHSSILYDSIKYAHEKGVLIVASSGNDGDDVDNYPAAYEEVIAVSATNKFDDTASFTNYGEWIEVAAPGVDILSTYPNNYYTVSSGTSMAAPCAAGVAALIWCRFPDFTRDQVWTQLQRTSDDLGDPGFDVHYGYGRINTRKAVENLPPQHDLTILSWNKPRYVIKGEPIVTNATVHNFGMNNEENVRIELTANGTIVAHNQINQLVSGESVKVYFSWSPIVEGLYDLTLRISNLDDVVDNNSLSSIVHITAPKTIYAREYVSVQEAIDHAHPWDTVFIETGTYYENIVIDKPLSIVGEDLHNTNINGNGSDVITVTASNVKISRLTIKNGGRGIFLFGSSGCTLTDNRVISNSEGIILEYSADNVLRNNWISNNEYNNFAVVGDYLRDFINDIDSTNKIEGKPIYYWINQRDMTVPSDAGYVGVLDCSRITIENLELQGVVCVSTDDSRIENLRVSKNICGIMLLDSRNNIMQNNDVTPCDTGISLTDSYGNTIRFNEVNGCTDGIILSHSSNNTIYDNDIEDNKTGIELEESSVQNVIDANYVRDNKQGILLRDSGNNILRDNLMVENKFSLGVTGNFLEDFLQNIDISNQVDWNPVYYIINQKDLEVNDRTMKSIGFLAFINCSGIKIRGIKLDDNWQGLLLAFTSNTEVRNLRVYSNYYGIHLVHSNDITIMNTTLTNIHFNIQLVGCHNVIIANNEFRFKYYTAGVDIKHSRHITVINNHFSEQSVGINLFSSEYNYIIGNTVEDGYIGFSGENFLHSNTITLNNFIDNNIQTYIGRGISSNKWDDGCDGNYWDDYRGKDSNGDGIGDTPYVIKRDENNDNCPLMKPYIADSEIMGDVNGDEIVDIFDAVRMATAFNSQPGDSNWNDVADINNDRVVSIFDIIIVVVNFGRR